MADSERPDDYDVWAVRVFDALTIIGGLVLACYEAMFREASDPGILLLAGGMMGLAPMRRLDSALKRGERARKEGDEGE